MRLLLTGATGFLGRHVGAAAPDGTVIRVTRAMPPAGGDEVALGPGPWTRADFRRALSEARPDVVLHCAGATHSPDARACFASNAALAADLLGAVVEARSSTRVILIGSAAEYGIVPAPSQPVRENHPCLPRSDYGVAKHAQSLLGLAAAAQGVPVLVARLFNPVGPGMPPGLALPSFARRIVQLEPRQPLRVGNLFVERDFIDVAEASRLLLALARMPDWPWPVVNLCSGRAYRLRDLLDGLLAAHGAQVSVLSDPALVRSGDMTVLIGCTERLKALGLAPKAPDFSALLPRLLEEARAPDTTY